MGFLDADYLLDSPTARQLYDHVADRPIVDPHTHADVERIADDEGWADIWAVEGATDHYVWQLMRKRGVPERKITGDAPNREKWQALTEIMPDLAGNPTYDWVHLDLRRRFGITDPIGPDTADDIWAETKAQLADDEMRPQPLLREMGVEVVGSTDDPTDSLEHHERLQDVDGIDVRPTWRADRVLKVDALDWHSFVADLESVTGTDASDLSGYLAALRDTRERFAEMGCVASDLGIEQPVSRPIARERAAAVYERAHAGEDLDREALVDLQAFLLERIGTWNAERDWVTQLHIGAVRDYRDSLQEKLGADAGGDVATQEVDVVGGLRHFLNAVDGETEVVVYVIDPTHYPGLTTVARAFPNVSVGPAWWFNDSPHGIADQLRQVGNVDLLANYAGMVSDSRKLLSYGSRFEMFRRTLASVVGEWVERGRVPEAHAERLVAHVAEDRPRELYGFEG